MNSSSSASSPGEKTGCRESRGIFAAKSWVLLSAWCSLTGWGLSACGRLDGAGYAVSFLAGGALFVLWARHAAPRRRPGGCWKRLFKRFRGPLPLIFLAAGALTLAGAVWYAPVNYDALTYRLPRILHWLADGRWHWLDTMNDRMNFSGTAFEWLMIPIVLATGGDRWVFLANFIPFLLLPGVTFLCLREMGARGRVAWCWMWLLPLGYEFVLQAGGIGNDCSAAIYMLLAVGLALRAHRLGRAGDLWISAVAMALVTGTKVINLPLLLPYAIATWPARRLVMKNKAASLVVLLVCVVVSFLPVALLNQRYSGNWGGDPGNIHHVDIHNPTAAFTGNALQIAVHNFEPPVLASALNGAVSHLTRASFLQWLVKAYPRMELQCGELPSEEGAGLGIGLCLLFFISLAAWRRKAGGATPAAGAKTRQGYLVAVGAWIALAVYMAKVGSESAPRLVAAYYPLCLALVLLHPGNARLARKRWWRATAALAMLSIFPAIILSPSRPLWPAESILPALAAQHPENRMIGRMKTVYEVYSHRAEVFAPLLRHIPQEERVIGFLGNGDDPTESLWRPYGSRRVVDFTSESEGRVAERYPRLIVVASDAGILQRYGTTMDAWMAGHNARLIAQEPIVVKIHRGAPEKWYVVELEAGPGRKSSNFGR